MQRLRIVACFVIALFCLCQAARAQGTVSAWGYNLYGQLGNGTLTDSNTSVAVSGLSGVTAIAGGAFHSLALKSDSTVWAWGYNYDGELGNGTYSTTFPYGIDLPVQVLGPGGVSFLTGVTAIAGGGYLSLALKSDGTVWAWGISGYGVLGNGTYAGSNVPVQVSGLTGVTAIAGGLFHGLALKSDGTVWAWGIGGYGQLGNGSFTGSNTPVQVLGPGGVGFLTGVTAIAGGFSHSLALKSDGTVWAWGDDEFGELGNGTYLTTPPYGIASPVQVSGLSGVTAIAGGAFHSLALKSDGTGWAWGSNGNGELGNGTFTTTPPYGIATPAQVSGLTGMAAIAGGGSYSLALESDSTVWAWGFGGSGQLGNGSNITHNTPVQVTGLSGVTAIAGGDGHSLALVSTPPVTYNSLINLVNLFVTKAGVAANLVATLQGAQRAAASGNVKSADNQLNSFINDVSAQSGKSMSAAQAATLIRLATALET